ncbi:MAG: enoyl-CoA hydratase-related protein [Actinomycetota bacterium]|nr:enoyl-CoA hydratase-related protein [Actinomycetota bacterium]
MSSSEGGPAATGSYPTAEGLQVVVDGPVLRLTLDRPEKKNALSDPMVSGLMAALERANNDDAIRAVMLDAAGRDFCVGADIVARNSDPSVKRRAGSIQRRLPGAAHRLIPLLTEVQVPIVCAVQGYAAGIGLHLALACDFTFVADDATLWEPFASRGFTPDSGGTWLLPRLVGVARARELLMLGRRLDGPTAAEWGLVHRSVPADRLVGEAGELLGELAAGPTVMLGLTKWLVNTGLSNGLAESLSDEAFAMELSSRSQDFREGLRAFAERRSPDFGGV